MNGEYVIIGDTKSYEGCLICVAGSYENAQKVLHRMLNNPDENDKMLMAGHCNLRIEEVPPEDCWWWKNCE